jgi:hypothetical protein
MSYQSLTLTTITPAGQTSRQQADVPWTPWPGGVDLKGNPVPFKAEIHRFSMSDQDHAWIVVAATGSVESERLFATNNGGRTWTDVTPKQQQSLNRPSSAPSQ